MEGETSTKKYSINDVETIVTKNDELTYTVHTYPFDNETKIEGNDLARIALEFFINPIPFLPSDVPAFIAIPCGFIVFIIAIALNPGSDS